MLRASDRHLLALLGEHQVLTTRHLARLTGMPERTVQYGLGILFRAGFVSRHRPRADIGTCPYHCWLTSFGASVVGAAPPGSWSEDPAGMRTVAALSDLWLGLEDHGLGAGLTLQGWRRLPNGLAYRDRRTGSERRPLADAELTVGFDGTREMRTHVFGRLDRVPGERLAPMLARWADYLPAPASANATFMALVLTGGRTRRDAVLDVARSVSDLADHVAVTSVGSQPGALATAAVWQRAVDGRDRRLAEVLASMEVGK